MRYKIIKDGEVVNTILAEPDFIEGYCAENGFTFMEEILPEPAEPDPELAPTLDERVQTLEASSAEMSEALELLMSGVTE